MSEYPNPLLEQIFVVPESSYGALADASPDLAIRHVRAAFTYTQERAPREDKHASRGVAERISRRKGLKYEVETYAIPSGTPGVAPDTGDLLQAHGLRVQGSSTTQVANSPAPTTMSCALTNADAAQVGSAVGFLTGGEFYLRVITGNEGGLIEWVPPLPVAPDIGDPIYGATNYTPQTDPQGSVSLWRFLDGVAFAYPGCVGESWELSVSGGQEARIRFSGMGGDERFAASDSLSANVDDEQTTIPMDHPERFEANMILLVGQERMKILGVDLPESLLNVERGYGENEAASHLAGCTATPWQPVANLLGSPATGICGRIEFDGALYEITEAVLKCEEGLLMRQAFGADCPVGFSYPDRRRVHLSLTGYLSAETAGRYGKIKNFETAGVFIQAGNVPGAGLAFYAPRFEADIPEITAEPGRETPLKLSGQCLESEGDDEFGIIFG